MLIFRGCRVPLDEPAWWYDARCQALARALSPLGKLYGAVAEARYRAVTPYRSQLPVICVGNFTAGGTGKTPLALLIAERLQNMGERPVFLTRGYGGSAKGPLWVDAQSHTAAEAGDEPLLLARAAAVMLARDRKAGARAIEMRAHEGCADAPSVILMDDGLQNPGLAKDMTIAVVDSQRGFGNGRVIPAGPLRARLAFQLGLCDAIVLNGAPATVSAGFEKALGSGIAIPLLRAHVAPAGDIAWIRDTLVLAYAGIGNPQRFFDLLAGAKSLVRVVFRDHHTLSEDEATRLLASADQTHSTLVTTEKDWVRLPDQGGALGALKARSRVLPVRTVLDPASDTALTALIRDALAAHRTTASRR